MMNQYLLSLGEFDTENYQLAGNDYIVWMVFIATTFITQITFLNMLIAIMGDTFDRASEVKEQSALKEKIEILADYVVVVGRESVAGKNLDEFIFAVMPATTSTDEIANWEGTVTSLKAAISVASLSIKAAINKKIGFLS